MLTKSGVPWEIVMDLDDTERRGMCIAVGINEGGVFDWNARRWIDKNA